MAHLCRTRRACFAKEIANHGLEEDGLSQQKTKERRVVFVRLGGKKAMLEEGKKSETRPPMREKGNETSNTYLRREEVGSPRQAIKRKRMAR